MIERRRILSIKQFFSLQTFLFSPYVALNSRNVEASKLSEKIVTSINGNIVEIRYTVTYDEIEEARYYPMRLGINLYNSAR